MSRRVYPRSQEGPVRTEMAKNYRHVMVDRSYFEHFEAPLLEKGGSPRDIPATSNSGPLGRHELVIVRHFRVSSKTKQDTDSDNSKQSSSN